MKNTLLIWSQLLLYAIAMAALEAAVVVYLRALFYGETVSLFPLQPLSTQLLAVELTRELATLIMLGVVGWILGKNTWSRIGYFLAAFGVWDIFYYVFLYLFIEWPESLIDWDVLFLIPVPWFGPVLAPCLVSVVFIMLGARIGVHEEKGVLVAAKREEIFTFLLGCVIILYTFMEDAIHLLVSGTLRPNDKEMMRKMANFIPEQYDWGIFAVGLGFLMAAWMLYYRRLRTSHLVLY